MHGLTISDYNYNLLKKYFGKIRIKVEHGNDVLYVWNEELNKFVYYCMNVSMIVEQIKADKI